jgi:hypothetical protein
MTPRANSSPANQPEYVEEPAIYTFVTTLTAGQHLDNAAVNIDRDTDWLWTGLNGSQTGNYTVNFRLPSGRQLANAEIFNQDIIGTANQPTVIGPPPVYRAGSVGPQVTITDISGGGNTVTIVFTGIRRVRTT